MVDTTNIKNKGSGKSMLKRILLAVFNGLVLIAVIIFAVFKLSPWPATLRIRQAWEEAGEDVSKALEKHVPSGIGSILNEQYDSGDGDAFLDVYFPSEIKNGGHLLPTIVWMHGGGMISGHKEALAPYCKILAGKGYTVVAIDYSLAPEKKYPTPVRQANAALAYLQKNSKRLHIDSSHFLLAGDSGGAQLAAQVANTVSVPSYAAKLGVKPAIQRFQISGVILFCGLYDLYHLNLDGEYGGTLKTTFWAYSGGKDFMTNPKFATTAVVNYLDAYFPHAFISVGNDDRLESQSRALAGVLIGHGVRVDTLFFQKDHDPALGHEYQFDLDSEGGRIALERLCGFLSGLHMDSVRVK